MKIHKEGHIIVFISTVIFVIAWALALTLNHWLYYILFVIPLTVFVGIFHFFRVPKRDYVRNQDVIFSPADGTVIQIEEQVEDEYFDKPMQHLSIFMSPLDVHLNRYPSDGKIIYYRYHPGKYLVAWHPKSSKLNERTSIVFETKSGMQYLVRQIAGLLARRIVFYGSEGKEVKQCDELGFIKFGSRLDLFLPPEVEVTVKPGDKVKGGISQLGIINNSK